MGDKSLPKCEHEHVLSDVAGGLLKPPCGCSIWDGQPVPPQLWGRDHLSTLLYIESACVDHGGHVEASRMRSWPGRPFRGKLGSGLAHQLIGAAVDAIAYRYPTRLKDGAKLYRHDDWDAVEDMITAKFILRMEGMPRADPVFSLTDVGWHYAWLMRRTLAEGRDLIDIIPLDVVGGPCKPDPPPMPPPPRVL